MDENVYETLTDPYTRNLVVVGLLLLATIGIGFFRAWDAGDAGYLLQWFWIGIAITIVYLLYRIASTVETVRAEL